MQQHRSEGATLPLVSPTAWLISWVGLEDSDTATLYQPMWGPRRLVVGSDTARCERVTRCVYSATISLPLCKNILTAPYSSFQDQCSPLSDTVESAHRKYKAQSLSSQTLKSLILWWLSESCRYLLFMCASQSENTIVKISATISLLLKWRWPICLSNVLMTFSCSACATLCVTVASFQTGVNTLNLAMILHIVKKKKWLKIVFQQCKTVILLCVVIKLKRAE